MEIQTFFIDQALVGFWSVWLIWILFLPTRWLLSGIRRIFFDSRVPSRQSIE